MVVAWDLAIYLSGSVQSSGRAGIHVLGVGSECDVVTVLQTAQQTLLRRGVPGLELGCIGMG